MPHYWDFLLPTRIHFGRGELRRLGPLAAELGKSALLVGYANLAGMEEAYARAERSLEKSGLHTTVFYEILPDPPAPLVERGARLAAQSGVDLVVGLGGGSAIDAAKGIAALVRMGGRLWDYTGGNPDSKPITAALPIVAVPTTAGTGAEVTDVAVFTHEGIGSLEGVAVKASASGPAIRPSLALVDPDLAAGCPPPLTAACGADALGHAIESCLSRRANPIASTLAGQAVGLIVAHLAEAVADPSASEPREPLALAATLAGAAFGSAGVVVPHAIAQALGGVLGVPHGVGVALGTRLGLRFNHDVCTAEYAELARFCDLPHGSDAEMADRFVHTIDGLLQRIGLPSRISRAGVPPDAIEILVRNAYDSTPAPITLNPRKVLEGDLRDFFAAILDDDGCSDSADHVGDPSLVSLDASHLRVPK